MQLTKMNVGIIVIIAVITGLSFFITDGIVQYGIEAPEGYNNSFDTIRNTQSSLYQNINSTYGALQDVDSNTATGSSGSTDFLGFFFNAGYTAAQTATGSITSVNTMIDVAIGSSGLGEYGAILKNLFLAAILVVMVIGILLNFIIKSGRE